MTRINLGSGWHYKPGWINVDLYAEQADLRADLRTVDFDPASVLLVEATHCIEHLTRTDTVMLLSRVFAWLRPGGRFIVEMPELSRCLRKATFANMKGLMGGRSNDKLNWNQWIEENRENIYAEAMAGRQTCGIVPDEYQLPGEAHLYVWDEAEFKEAMEQAGFYVTVEKPMNHGKREKRDCRWVGGKP